ncbi:S-adenosyl-L-methionine-dependent methyltransferase [Aspergillus novoparasiticus]|uniref:S-adenosyl-L-methionine-dependent methyltransferase n=1 Tax=Aspergillus novoparasiticus TaxID=986946 RepID=A0A5N6F3N2_9EURO|nr:S-adenosyl-L-methionine-dependent methyltransferase [Aspergillus novoparasiticus]
MDAPLTDVERTALQTSLEALNRQVGQYPVSASRGVTNRDRTGYVSTKCLCAAVELKLVDILADADEAGMTVDELADASGAHPDRLQQVLRVLRNDNIFDYDAVSHRYRNNRVSALLHSKHWTQWHNWVDLYGNEFYDIARGIPRSIRREEARWAAQINFDTNDDMFTYFQAQGWLPRLHRTLGGGAIAQAPGIVADYPWHEIGSRTVLDVGGGGGGFLASLLREYPQMRGGILDLPRPYFDLRERVPRENLIAGDFLKAVPAFEVYTMKWVLHDWKDPDVLTILRCIRASLIPGPDSRLVILESNLSDGQMGRLSRYGDINMMMTANGQERSEEQWRALAAASGWEISRIYPMRRAWMSSNTISSDPNGAVVMGDMEYDGRVILYIIKADETSYINYIKPLILAEEIQFPHVLSVIDTRDEWFYSIHPERMVPSLKDQDPVTGEKVIVFESTACLQYLVDRFDTDGTWSGRTVAEKGAILSWTAYQTAALGPTAKYWLYFKRGYPTRANPVQLPRTIEKLHANTLRQWDILEKRLKEPGQQYIALKDRPTLADLSYFPFAMPWMFTFLGVDIKDWPHIQRWSEMMLSRPAVARVLQRAPTLGH